MMSGTDRQPQIRQLRLWSIGGECGARWYLIYFPGAPWTGMLDRRVATAILCFGVAPATGMVKVNLGKVGRGLARNRGETMGFHMVQNTPLCLLSPLCHAHLAGLTPSRLPRVAAAAPLWHFAACVFGVHSWDPGSEVPKMPSFVGPKTGSLPTYSGSLTNQKAAEEAEVWLAATPTNQTKEERLILSPR